MNPKQDMTEQKVFFKLRIDLFKMIVDIWACGVVLYNLISGKFPFEFDDEPNVLALHEKIIKGKYDMPEEALFPCDDLIRNILKHDVNQRYTIEQILAHPWVLSQGPIAATTSGIQTFQHSKENLLIPCETTMLPYLSQLYLKDIEKDIAENGLISDYLKKNRETQDNLEVIYFEYAFINMTE